MTNEDLNNTIHNVKEAWKYPELYQNVSRSERWLSGAAGTYLLYKGITGLFSHPVIGLTGAAIGAGLLYRGITGYCPVRDLSQQEEEGLIPDEVVVTETYVVDDLA
ncbi:MULTISPECIES: YgaP family membrane protein [Pedobacter]|uniref:DUF2892 domain-containing protein n=2 Tax=Pedobacter TaxID=84567 RepID=A0A3N0C3U3_9SPHI|nr:MULTISPECIES: DUF2892 domain-containing protein [Pedobacter]RNL56949.1 DUF2892 domain-containing protein [Pedobacter jejuensis]GGI28329.1 hypothetical protein GCM10008119_32110 [Pedobacter mendelii]